MGRKKRFSIAAFLTPTPAKGIFLVEWTVFILLSLLRGELASRRDLLVASCPLVFFYLVACALSTLARRTHQLARGWRLPAVVLSLIGVDQLGKTMVVALIPLQRSIPIVEGWLHLAHERNVEGSWLMSTLNVRSLGRPLLLGMVGLAVLLISPLCYRYYVSTQRKSVWADAAIVGLFAGLASWVCDVGLRGHVIDYIQLPGVVTADLKDVLLTVGAAALLVEAVENPGLSWRWRGWRREAEDLRRLAVDIAGFSLQEWHGIRQRIVGGRNRGPGR